MCEVNKTSEFIERKNREKALKFNKILREKLCMQFSEEREDQPESHT